MSKYYKELTDEELKAEVERLEGCVKPDSEGTASQIGVQEVLKIYREEIRLREALPL